MKDQCLVMSTFLLKKKLDWLRCSYPSLHEALSKLPMDSLSKLWACQHGGPSHPLVWIWRGAEKKCALKDLQALGNTEMASRQMPQQCRDRLIKKAASSKREDSAGALAEIRAFEYLKQIGLDIQDNTMGEGPDFFVEAADQLIEIEVAAKLMSEGEEEKWSQFSGNSMQHEHCVYPAGYPADGETSVENLASKIAAKLTEEAEQFSGRTPSIIWLDLQFKEWFNIPPQDASPIYVLRGGLFRTGPLWLAAYGCKGTRLIDNESIQEGLPPEARGVRYTRMRFSGHFQQTVTKQGEETSTCKEVHTSAILFSLPQHTVLLENPFTPKPLPQDFLKMALRLGHFNWNFSWFRPFWKCDEDALRELLDKTQAALRTIEEVGQIARLSW